MAGILKTIRNPMGWGELLKSLDNSAVKNGGAARSVGGAG